ncbi:pentraxin fusion protein-like [Anabas testudineus]|uniref:Pentraxin family member n=1 Tax=Anabas testudineus TaxID=64144 RepID=A0AAQ6IAI3_ANATE|nr:pentraxin fusion protein-like [Anabas testudineus]
MVCSNKLRLWIVVFLTVACTVWAGEVTIKNLVFPNESDNSYVELVPEIPLNLKAFTLCMRVATELQGKREIILFAYRTKDYDELNVWRELDGRLSFYLAGDGVLFQVPDLGGLETHLCVIWDSSSGASALFVNGRRSLTKIYKQDHTIKPDGKVILGQDPDSYLGDFETNQSFVGSISDVNMWDIVLSDGTIQDIYTEKRVPRGNIFDWQSIKFNINGAVQVVDRDL